MGGKMRLPAPKNIENSVMPTAMDCRGERDWFGAALFMLRAFQKNAFVERIVSYTTPSE